MPRPNPAAPRSTGGQMTHPERAKRREKIIKALRRGDRSADVAREFGLSSATIRAIARDEGIAQPQAQTPVGAWRVLAELLNTTDTQAAIAERLGVAPQYVGAIKRKAAECGIKLRR